MKLEMPLKIKSVHLHVEYETLAGDAATDLLINDPDNDGDPNYRLKWVAPGPIPDSGPDGLQGEIPLAGVFKTVGGLMVAAAKGVASGPLKALFSMINVSDD